MDEKYNLTSDEKLDEHISNYEKTIQDIKAVILEEKESWFIDYDGIECGNQFIEVLEIGINCNREIKRLSGIIREMAKQEKGISNEI